MLSRCTLTFMLMASLSTSVAAKPVVIHGNANGLWSPTHPHLTGGKDKPHSPVLYQPPPVIEPEVAIIETTPDVCPTLQSAPHLCQDL